jgi:hypothetical protein
MKKERCPLDLKRLKQEEKPLNPKSLSPYESIRGSRERRIKKWRKKKRGVSRR